MNWSEMVQQFKSKKTLSTEDLVQLTKLLSRSVLDRQLFYSTKDEYSDCTLAQKIYGEIYRRAMLVERKNSNGEFDPFGKGIDEVFSKDLADEYRETLKKQNAVQTQKVKQQYSGIELFHVSDKSPNEIEGLVLRPRLQEEAYRDRGKINAVFASPNKNSSVVAWARGSGASVFGFGKTGPEKIIVVSDEKAYMSFQCKHPYTYMYQVPAEMFEPNIGYDGNYGGEWVCKDRSVPLNPKKCIRISIDDMVRNGAKIYFTRNKQDFDMVRKTISDARSMENLIKSGVMDQYEMEKRTMEDLVKKGIVVPYKMGTLTKLLQNKTSQETYE